MSNSTNIINQPVTYEGKVIFNINTWNINDKTLATIGMLKSYANLYTINIFTNLNIFQSIQSTEINGVAENVFDYLKISQVMFKINSNPFMTEYSQSIIQLN